MNIATMVVLVLVLGIITLPLYWLTHILLQSWYQFLARRWCARQGMTPLRWRSGPEFDSTGIKTEFTVVEVECDHPEDGRKYVQLRIWVFGVRQVFVNSNAAPTPLP